MAKMEVQIHTFESSFHLISYINIFLTNCYTNMVGCLYIESTFSLLSHSAPLLCEARSVATLLLGAVIAKVSWTSHPGLFLVHGLFWNLAAASLLWSQGCQWWVC